MYIRLDICQKQDFNVLRKIIGKACLKNLHILKYVWNKLYASIAEPNV